MNLFSSYAEFTVHYIFSTESFWAGYFYDDFVLRKIPVRPLGIFEKAS